jgi:hypothetical protein
MYRQMLLNRHFDGIDIDKTLTGCFLPRNLQPGVRRLVGVIANYPFEKSFHLLLWYEVRAITLSATGVISSNLETRRMASKTARPLFCREREGCFDGNPDRFQLREWLSALERRNVSSEKLGVGKPLAGGVSATRIAGWHEYRI